MNEVVLLSPNSSSGAETGMQRETSALKLVKGYGRARSTYIEVEQEISITFLTT